MRKSLYDFCLELGYPAPLEEWDEEANGPLTEKVSYGSKRKYWWRCEKGHRWEAAVMSRTGERTGCPYCAGISTTSSRRTRWSCGTSRSAPS